MDYWRGIMNLSLPEEWKCQTCETKGPLIWGIINGQCRCYNCHTQYSMRNGIVWVYEPICQLKDDYKTPARLGYEKFRIPISEWDDTRWDEAFSLTYHPDGIM